MRRKHILPRIWISEAAYPHDPQRTDERRFSEVYPTGFDRGGRHALELAERYFGEGLNYDTSCTSVYRDFESLAKIEKIRSTRLACFQAAEILYLHAAKRKNDLACVRLSYLYLNDLCCGNYWYKADHCIGRHADHTPLEIAACDFLSQAVSRGFASARLLLGDLKAQGRGCKASGEDAFRLYLGAFGDLDCDLHGRADLGCDLHGRAMDSFEFEECLRARLEEGFKSGGRDAFFSHADPTVAGLAALRLGNAHEQAIGCAFDLRAALGWYRIAKLFLKEDLRIGAWRSKRAYLESCTGISRIEQDLDGRY